MDILFITANKSYLAADGPERKFLQGMADAATTLHVIVLTHRRDGFKTEKYGEHTWIYPTNGFGSWLQFFAILRTARFQLFWDKQFRAHVIYSDDPDMCGWAGMLLAWKYDRVWIVNVNSYRWGWRRIFSAPWRLLTTIPLFVVCAAAYRVCVFSELVRIKISNRISKETEQKLFIFPRIWDAQYVESQESTIDIKKQYPEFNFILLTVFDRHASGRAPLAVDILRLVHERGGYSKAGLVVVGGLHSIPRVKSLLFGLGEWVRFERSQPELTSYFRTANVFLYFSGSEADEDILIQAAMAHCAIIAVRDDISRALITDGVNGFLLSQMTPKNVAQAIFKLNETPILREMFRSNSNMHLAQTVIQKPEQIVERFRTLWTYTEAPELPQDMPLLHPHPVKQVEESTGWEKFRKVWHEMFPPKNRVP